MPGANATKYCNIHSANSSSMSNNNIVTAPETSMCDASTATSTVSILGLSLCGDKLDDESLQKIKSVCKDAFIAIENIGKQAHKEIKNLDETEFNDTLFKFYCKKAVWFIEFVNSTLIPHNKKIERVLKEAEALEENAAASVSISETINEHSNEIKNEPFQEIVNKTKINRLSLKRLSDDVDTQDIFSEPENIIDGTIDGTSIQSCQSTSSVTQFASSDSSNKAGAENVENFSFDDICAELKKEKSIKDEPVNYESFEDKSVIDALVQDLLDHFGGDETESQSNILAKKSVECINNDKEDNEQSIDNIMDENNTQRGTQSKTNDDEIEKQRDSDCNLAVEMQCDKNPIVENLKNKTQENETANSDCDKSYESTKIVEYQNKIACDQHEDISENGDENNDITACNVTAVDTIYDDDNHSNVYPIEEIACESNISEPKDDDELPLKKRRTEELEAIKILGNIGCDTSDFDTSEDIDSADSESEESSPIVRHVRPPGKEMFIQKNVLDVIDSELIEMNENLICTYNEEYYCDKFDLKSCSVDLINIDKTIASLLQDEATKTFYDKEIKEIERLTDMNSLKRTRRRSSYSSGSSSTGMKKRRKISRKSRQSMKHICTSSDGTTSDSDITDIECNLETVNKSDFPNIAPTVEPFMPIINSDAIIQEILNYAFTDSENSEHAVISSDETDVEKDNDIRVRTVDKNNEDTKSGDNNNKEKYTDPDTLKRKKWRHNSLLTGKLTDSSSSDEDNDGNKQERRNPKKPFQERLEVDDVTDLDKTNLISLSSDSENSDVEFVRTTHPSKERCSGDSDAESSDVEEVKKTGRRNIRALKSDELLEEATKRAAKEEDERTQRILMKTKNLSVALSQVSTVYLHGLVLDVDEDTNEPIISVNVDLSNKLKTHQKAGVQFMWNTCFESVNRLKNNEGTGCILAHCMGLGKTLQVVTLIHTLISHSATNIKHVLIVCPLSTVLNWEHEFKIGVDDLDDGSKIRRFCISNRRKDKEYRINLIKEWRRSTGILILGYEAYQTLIKMVPEDNNLTQTQQDIKEALLDPGPDLVICDEGHLLKNGRNNRTKSLMKIKTKRRIILTGTPLQNNLIEYYYMVKFVKPNLLGTLAEYSNRFVNPITNGQYDDSTDKDIQLMRKRSHVLHKILKQTVQRYEVTELKNYLPDMTDYVINILLHPVQVNLYKTYLDKAYVEGRCEAKRFFIDFNNLRKVWTHPYLLYLVEQHTAQLENKKKLEVDTINLDDISLISEQSSSNCNISNGKTDCLPRGWWEQFCPEDFKTNVDYGPKFKVLLGILEECEKVQDKVLIFSCSLAELDCIEYFLKTVGTPGCRAWKRKEQYLRMDGTVPPDTRMRYCNYFNNPANTNMRVFLISHRVGGLGLNLVAANRIILMDVNFNPAYDLQSIFRIYRFGQKKDCFVYRLVAKGTMEEVNYERCITKLAIAGRVVDQLQVPRHYKSSDLQKMYRFKIYDEPTTINKAPSDDILNNVLQKFKSNIYSYHEHQSLLENLSDEVLNEAEMKTAWEEFNTEQKLKQFEKDNVQLQGSNNKPLELRRLENKDRQRIRPLPPRPPPRDLIFTQSYRHNDLGPVLTKNNVQTKLFMPLTEIQVNKSGESASQQTIIDLKRQLSNALDPLLARKLQTNGFSAVNLKNVLIDKNNKIIGAVPTGSPDLVDNFNIARGQITSHDMANIISGMTKNIGTKSAPNTTRQQTDEVMTPIVDVEQEDLLKQISYNDSLTLSTVLKECEKLCSITETNDNIIEID